ncbi:restriction endonuclease subunit S [Deinococcus sp. AJ005]|uniref:restriction endonuclease subunit S n=1 Tax=Deinococcus sp. AJ005 TaxID=2652443 RepID=UPI00125CA953|nr:restriction endonuclease subunit S [Deinococcus sp. AJ005]QFP77462.1 restriction endonuclease subunit S [Deinococcus sp. AJ005]
MIHALTPYPAMKDSGVPWLGQVPEHWDVTPALAVYKPREIKNKGMIEKTVLSLSYGRIVIKPEEKLRGLVPESFETYQIVEPGNIIVRTTDLQNDKNSLRIGHAKDRGIITSAYMCLETTDRVLNEFGYQYLNAYDLLKIIYGYGSGLRQNLDFKDIRRMPVLVPSHDEQNAIVRYLDHADRRIRRTIAAKQKLIKLLQEQKQVIIHQAVTRGLDPDVKLKPSGVEWLGDVPKGWEVKRLKSVCLDIIDCKNRTPEQVDDGEFTVVRTTNIRNGQFKREGSFQTNLNNFTIWTQRGAPQEGDVFFTREAPVGEACLVPAGGGLCMGQRMMYFRPDPTQLNSKFLLHSIYGPMVQRYMDLELNGSTVGHLRLGQITAIPLLICPVSEQEAIVKHIDHKSEELDKVISRAQSEISLLREYRTRLIADVVTGKLDVRDAAALLPELDADMLPDEVETDVDELELDEGEGEVEEEGVEA